MLDAAPLAAFDPAQQPSKLDAAPLSASDPAQLPSGPGAAAPSAPRRTWERHFDQADIAHDGHLTREEAKGGYAQVAKHFDDIDVDHKGYVTANDIRAWRVMRKAAQRLAKPPPDKLKPQHAFQARHQNPKPIPAGQRTALPMASHTMANAGARLVKPAGLDLEG